MPVLCEKLESLFAWHDYAHSRGQIAKDLATPEERARLYRRNAGAWCGGTPANGRGALDHPPPQLSELLRTQSAARESRSIDELIAATTAALDRCGRIWLGQEGESRPRGTLASPGIVAGTSACQRKTHHRRAQPSAPSVDVGLQLQEHGCPGRLKSHEWWNHSYDDKYPRAQVWTGCATSNACAGIAAA